MLLQQAGSCPEPGAEPDSSTGPSFLALRPAVMIAVYSYLISLTWLYHIWSYLHFGDKQLLSVKHDRSDWWGLCWFSSFTALALQEAQSKTVNLYIISIWIMPLVNSMACLQSFDYSSHPELRNYWSLQKKGKTLKSTNIGMSWVDELEREVQVLISDRVEGWHVPTDYFFFQITSVSVRQLAACVALQSKYSHAVQH